jgi:hypothetical protein
MTNINRLIKETVKNNNLYKWFSDKWFAEWSKKRKIDEWERRGKPAPPPDVIKHQVLQDFATKYNLKTLVETGTYYGGTIEAMKSSFDRIYSIELSENLYKKAKKKFKEFSHIELICGDSGVELINLLPQINEPALFWLDGHYSGGETARGEEDTPIYKELLHILNSPCKEHVIVIDDARFFDSDPSYPSIENIKDFVKSKRLDLDITVKDDSIRIIPIKITN